MTPLAHSLTLELPSPKLRRHAQFSSKGSSPHRRADVLPRRSSRARKAGGHFYKVGTHGAWSLSLESTLPRPQNPGQAPSSRLSMLTEWLLQVESPCLPPFPSTSWCQEREQLLRQILLLVGGGENKAKRDSVLHTAG